MRTLRSSNLRKTSKFDATRCQNLRLKCSKFDFCGLHPRPRQGSLQQSPRPLAVFKQPTSKGKEWGREEGKGRKGEEKGRRGEGRGEGNGGKDRGGDLPDQCQTASTYAPVTALCPGLPG